MEDLAGPSETKPEYQEEPLTFKVNEIKKVQPTGPVIPLPRSSRQFNIYDDNYYDSASPMHSNHPITPVKGPVYDCWGNEKPKSPETLRRLLREAQAREVVDTELTKMKVIPELSPWLSGVPLSPRNPRQFPVFPLKKSGHEQLERNKPFIPDDYLIQKMSDIPGFLDRYKPRYVHAMFGNYIASCDEINDKFCPMRIGQLSIFIPVNMKSGETIIVGLAPAELFHSAWRGTGSPAPPPDRSIIGKRAYEVDIHHPLRADCTISRHAATPTGNTQGTVIGIVGGACVLRIEKWFLRSGKYHRESRTIPVMGAPLPQNPKVVLYNSPQVYNEYKRELERQSQERKEMEQKLAIVDLGGTLDTKPLKVNSRVTAGRNATPPALIDLGPISRPRYLSLASISGILEPREEPVRVPWGTHGVTNNREKENIYKT
ncbi:hypothetical protein ABW20_dc0108963 [Dactylellina cionopaga]|nr:hypothetical protein ABW20_dc0108963 [Dactylellina cionopaga]